MTNDYQLVFVAGTLHASRFCPRFPAARVPTQVSDTLPSLQANGNLVKVLIHTDVTKYLEFKAVDGSYVMNKGRVEKASATP